MKAVPKQPLAILVSCPCARSGRRFLDDHTMGKFLRDVSKDLGLVMACKCCSTPAAWYEYTRHTYGCQMIMAGGAMEDLARTMGHSTTAITEKHYVHLRPAYYRVSARNLLTADFAPESGQTATETATGGVVARDEKEIMQRN